MLFRSDTAHLRDDNDTPVYAHGIGSGGKRHAGPRAGTVGATGGEITVHDNAPVTRTTGVVVVQGLRLCRRLGRSVGRSSASTRASAGPVVGGQNPLFGAKATAFAAVA